jgi:hypothetical protein|tara:strand:+ start:346 stop:537 length:192 start_codon:yes stop_codon:yes gene_type:complete
MTITVKETWWELVQRENVFEVEDMEEAYNGEIMLGSGDEVSSELHLKGGCDIEYEILEEVSDE